MSRKRKIKKNFLENFNIDLNKINLDPSKKIQETKEKISNFYKN